LGTGIGCETHMNHQITDAKSDDRVNRIARVAIELLLMLVPFIVYMFVLSFQGKMTHLLFIPEWSIAGSVLVAQGFIKFQDFVHYKRVHLSRVRLVEVILLILFGINLVILSLVILGGESGIGLAITKLVFFALGVLAYVHLGLYCVQPQLDETMAKT